MSTPTFTPGQRVRVVAPGRIFDGMTGVVAHVRADGTHLVASLDGERDAWCLCLAHELVAVAEDPQAIADAAARQDAEVERLRERCARIARDVVGGKGGK